MNPPLGSRDALWVSVFLALCSVSPLHAKTHYVTFNADVDTFPMAINSKGVIAGAVNLNNAGEGGFVRQPDGTIERFYIPGSRYGVLPTSINDHGDVTGYYYGDPNSDHTSSFIRRSNGTIKTFDPRRAPFGDSPVFISSARYIFGSYQTHGQVSHGFVRNPQGTTTSFDCVQGGATFVYAANDFGETAGSADDFGGFLRDPDGTCTEIDAGVETNPLAMNSEGSVVGSIGYPPVTNFIRTPDGAISAFSMGSNLFSTLDGGRYRWSHYLYRRDGAGLALATGLGCSEGSSNPAPTATSRATASAAPAPTNTGDRQQKGVPHDSI